ncbi:YgiW/YdeI family stress tolerance OB fold protein [Actinobacillus arthritidis]|uniref:YgiW/YdeI family stress tolerance OB fold protein n=1 Tax=Actinobacillus arthritidis TaxID=157339 RepID=UPI00244152FE|nr:NirD/YgiW/YdeI family stress tolerance protein [Actinobacillus arthritidis]WGE89695.1 NirD/YgiW/YdeI family stress tolerance protein [Actinobacillus arthritidis]
MKKLFTFTAVLTASLPAIAGFQDNTQAINSNQVTVIKSVAKAKTANEDMPVRLTGYITRQVDSDEFYFKDASGEIKIDVEDHAWNGQNVTPKHKITIEGKVDRNDAGRADIDVYRIKKH